MRKILTQREQYPLSPTLIRADLLREAGPSGFEVRPIDPFDVSDEADHGAGLFPRGGQDPLASLAWRRGGEVAMISTHPEYQRQGLATQLFNHVKQHLEPGLHHSPHQTAEGEAWARQAAADDNHLVLYHGTGTKHLDAIKNQGLMPRGAFSAGWPMLTTDFDQAARYTGGRPDAAVLEYHVPKSHVWSRGREPGSDPSLWPGIDHNVYDSKAQAYSLRRPLTNEFLHKVHEIGQGHTAALDPEFEDDDPHDHTAYRKQAMPRQDAYNEGWPEDKRQTEEPTYPADQRWFHRSDHDLPEGTMLVPGGGKSKFDEHYDGPLGMSNHRNWVWMSTPEWELGPGQGKHLYQVQPEGEGPYPWNDDDMQHVAPRAKIVKKLPSDYDPRTARTDPEFEDDDRTASLERVGDNGLTPYQMAQVGATPDLSAVAELPEHGGRWNFPHEGFEPNKYNPEHGHHSWGIHPTDAPAQFDQDAYGRKKTVYYNPALTQVSKGEFRPQTTNNGNRIDDLQQKQPGTIWRGMSHEEYEGAKRNGYFQSNGSYNFEGQQGATLFADEPSMAGSYASHYAPYQHMPTFTRPSHVIGIPDQNYPRNSVGEVEVPGQIPFGAATHHYQGDVVSVSPGSYGGHQDAPNPDYGYNGFREQPSRKQSPSASLQWSAQHPQRTASLYTDSEIFL